MSTAAAPQRRPVRTGAAEQRILGADQSPTHAGYILMDAAGKIMDLRYATEKASAAARSKEHGVRHATRPKTRELSIILAERISWWESFMRALLNDWRPTCAVVEDYALREAHGAHQIGEVGGMLRCKLWDRGIPARYHDPTTLKMFVAENGNAKANEVEAAVRERWGHDWRPLCNSEKDLEVAEDLAHAFAAAHIGWAELAVRRGELDLTTLTVKQRAAFLRVTKRYPVNLLDRPWAKNGGEL